MAVPSATSRPANSFCSGMVFPSFLGLGTSPCPFWCWSSRKFWALESGAGLVCMGLNGPPRCWACVCGYVWTRWCPPAHSPRVLPGRGHHTLLLLSRGVGGLQPVPLHCPSAPLEVVWGRMKTLPVVGIGRVQVDRGSGSDSAPSPSKGRLFLALCCFLESLNHTSFPQPCALGSGSRQRGPLEHSSCLSLC